MGTRGAYGFRKNGVDKVTYSHFDSYPTGLGSDIAIFINEVSVKEMNRAFNNIILVDENEGPTEEQIKEAGDFYNGSVGEQRPQDWYCLLRESQGNLFVYTEDKLKYMIDSSSSLLGTVFCEWVYIINLDENVLEIYGSSESERKGRYPISLIASIPFNKVSEEAMEKIEKDAMD